MTCPHCNQSFAMTWGRYLRAPGGRHVCPACGQKSTFRGTLGYFALMALVSVISVGGLLGLVVLIYPQAWEDFLRRPYLRLAFFLVGVLPGVLFDKYYEGRYRKLEKLPG